MLKCHGNSIFSAEEEQEDLDPYYKAQALYGNKGGKEENSTFSAEEEEREHLDPYIKRRALYRNKTAQNSIFSAEILSGLIANHSKNAKLRALLSINPATHPLINTPLLV